MDESLDDLFNSPSMDESLMNAVHVATLAERFNMTSFKPFQKEIIDATLNGRDTLVIQPTGSGKSLCFQFPPVHTNKKSIVISPTISLMQDQVHKLNGIGISAVLLGSAQLDHRVEVRALKTDSKEQIIFVTPEWIAKPDHQLAVHSLIKSDCLSLIAIDEAHLITEWSNFRRAFNELRKLKSEFPSTPIMALTATATPAVKEDVLTLLRCPVISQSSMNRKNITLRVEELQHIKGVPEAVQFSNRVAAIVNSDPTIIYTDFVADIGPIVSALQDVEIEAVGYHGEMDIPSRHESYIRWKSGEVNVIVATKAFGMGIDKENIRHVIRNGVPESMLSWAQELGRAGRDGHQASATILYRKSDVSHANSWILNNLSNREHCNRILDGFSESWKYINAHLAGKCRRQILLDIFGETDNVCEAYGECCDVCLLMKDSPQLSDCKPYLEVLVDALKVLGCKGEVKIAEWIRGSKLDWTRTLNKTCLSYGNHKNKDLVFWRNFIKQCHVLKFVKLELRSMIKGNGMYSVNGVYYVSQCAIESIQGSEPLLLYCKNDSPDRAVSQRSRNSLERIDSATKKRLGKGSNILSIVKTFISEPENWIEVENKNCYQFPGTFSRPRPQHLYYVENVQSVEQSCQDPHFLWKDIQLSKGQLNRDRLITVDISGKKEEVYYRSAPCSGVKSCRENDCDHVVPIRDKRNCPKHNIPLEKTSNCPIEFVYIHPKSTDDHRRWFGGIVRCQKNDTKNLHNHPIHASSSVCERKN